MRHRVLARKWLNRLRFGLTGVRRIRINGVTISSPMVAGVTCPPSEPWMLDVLRVALAMRQGTFVDVGVNVGQTLVKVKALDPERNYVGFEPNPFCAFYAMEVIKRNRFRNCALVPVGLYTDDGLHSLDLYHDYPADATASLVAEFRPTQKPHSRMLVPVFKYETVADALALDRVGVVKIDVEGGELEVLKGMSATIAKDRPVLLLEVLPVYSEANDFRKTRQDEIWGLVQGAGYAVFRIEKTKKDRYAGLAPVESFGIHSDLSRCDYIVVPGELADQVMTRPASAPGQR